jgi:hypothetical protein
MKPLIFVFAFSFLLFNQLYSQLSVGLKAGGNISTMKFNEEPDYPEGVESFNETVDWLDGIQGGLQFAYKLAPVEFAGEVLYAQKGQRVVDEIFFTSERVETRLRLHYFSLPLITRIYLTDAFYLGAGGEVSYMIAGKLTNDRDDSSVDILDEDTYVLEVNRLDVGVLAEAGFKLPMGIGIQLRYVHSFGDYYNGNLQFTDPNGEPLAEYDPKLRNRSLQLSLTYDLISASND